MSKAEWERFRAGLNLLCMSGEEAETILDECDRLREENERWFSQVVELTNKLYGKKKER